jgi:hypothetical protein
LIEIDHIVLGCATLAQGARFVEDQLGAAPLPGGAHAGMGTHNLLLGLGAACYLEVIAPDPEQPDPPRPRLFGLDDAKLRRALARRPRLVGYVARTSGLAALAARLGPARLPAPFAMRRGDLSWRMALFAPGPHGQDPLVPGLIEWEGRGAAARLPDSGCRLLELQAEHPDPAALRAVLADCGLLRLVGVRESASPRFTSRLQGLGGREVTFATD